ncbi:MAG: flagellar biosynthetic protein FliR [Thermodesulfobacteriota bacterium]
MLWGAWPFEQIKTFILILMRVTAVLFFMPVLGTRNIPAVSKIGLSMIISLLLLPLVKIDPQSFPKEPLFFVSLLLKEIILGMVLGLSVKVIFAGVQAGGHISGFHIGFTMAQIIDPQSESQETVLTQLYFFLSLLIFLAIDGHHWFIRALTYSFEFIPLGSFFLKAQLGEHLLKLSGTIFIIAVKIAAPILVALFLVQMGLGILAKAAPQINIMMTSFPLIIAVGLLILALSTTLVMDYLKEIFLGGSRGLVLEILPLAK